MSDAATPGRRSPLAATAGPLADIVTVLGIFAVLGVLAALAWWLAVDPAMFTKVESGGAMDEVELAKRFDGDAWYAVIAAVCGLLAGSLLTWWRRRDFLLTTVLLALGSALAAATMALLGELLGPPDPDSVMDAAEIWSQVPAQLEVTSSATYLVWPIATLVGALIVLWSNSRLSAGDEEHEDYERQPPEVAPEGGRTP